MNHPQILAWLLSGDPSVAFQTKRDLLDEVDPVLQQAISISGWGQAILAQQLPNGHWGREFYQPKWTNTHYTLLELTHLQLPPTNPVATAAVLNIADHEKVADGGVGPGKTIRQSDVCVAGMFLNYASYFQCPEAKLESVVDFLLSQTMADGGFNCQLNRSGARHSSMHSTLSVLEGIERYRQQGHAYRLNELLISAAAAREFLLCHRLFKSDKTGDIIHKSFLQFSFPARWKYNILRALDYFQMANIPWDHRMQEALEVVLEKRKPDGRWLTAAHHPGIRHLTMEPARSPSRWNTLMALRVLRQYQSS